MNTISLSYGYKNAVGASVAVHARISAFRISKPLGIFRRYPG